MDQLRGHVALVTGGGRGIGRSTAIMLARLGAAVVVLARNADEVEAVTSEIRAGGRRAIAIASDVSEQADLEKACATSLEAFGPIDILVNNASVLALGSVAEVDPAEWVAAIEINVIGTFRCMRAVLPHMLDRRWGRIVNVSSVLATVQGGPYRSAYICSKAAVDQLTRSVAGEVVDSGVLINGVYPGVTDTDMQRQLREAPEGVIDAELREWYRNRYATGDIHTPDNVARLIVAIILSSFNGEIINMDDERGQELLRTMPE
jgi:NAD(P)-dependent dehydrogenase (short-subunit alcohol dehydrogenase family)